MFDLNWVGQIPLMMAPPPADGSGPPAWVQILPLGILFVLMYFVLLRPQMKRQKETEKLIQSVKTGESGTGCRRNLWDGGQFEGQHRDS